MAVKLITTIQNYVGLAADVKPTGVNPGSIFYAYDTGVKYITYDGTNYSVYDAYDQEEKAVATSAAVMSNALTTFTIAGGPIEIQNLIAVCVTDNNVTGSTLLFFANPTDGTATDLCAASGSLTNATAGTIVNITGTVANAAVITANGTAIAQLGKLVVPVGIIGLTVGTGSTTGTWTINMRYKPLARGITVTAAY